VSKCAVSIELTLELHSSEWTFSVRSILDLNLKTMTPAEQGTQSAIEDEQKKRMNDMDLDEIIIESQEKYIKENFGDKAEANIGWGVDEGDDYLTYQTKVYGHGILTTTVNKDGEIIDEDFESF